jgi:hypothetical protein
MRAARSNFGEPTKLGVVPLSDCASEIGASRHGGEDRMLYFAYGSNMDWDQMQSRCPSAQFVAIASLPHHQLSFPRHSKTRKCDVASIAAATGEAVWEVVYRIDDADRRALDACEGFNPERDPTHNSYAPIKVMVLIQGDPAQPIDVFTYKARPQPNFTPRGPNSEYRNLILGSAAHWQLPEDYQRALEATCRTR